MAKLRWRETTSFGGKPLVFVSWDDVDVFLGHSYRGSAKDDRRIVKGLLESGAPAWTQEPNLWGFTTPQGWFIERTHV